MISLYYFLMFFNKAENMAIQNKEASLCRPFNYSIENVKNSFTHYQKDLYELLHSDNVDVCYRGDDSDFYVANADQLDAYKWNFFSRYKDDSDATSYLSVQTFYENTELTAQRYFQGFYDAYTVKAGGKSLWDMMMEKVG